MIRVFAMHKAHSADDCGWHIVTIQQTMGRAIKAINRKWLICASFGKDLWYDNGAGTAFKRLTPTL